MKIPFFIQEFTDEMEEAAIHALRNESFVGGESDPDAPKLFQVAIVDSCEIKFVHGEEVKQILSKLE